MKSMRKSKLGSNIIFSFVYEVLMLCFPLIVTPYVSRTLGASGIGTYAYHYAIAHYFAMVAMLGLRNYGNRCIASCKKDDKEERSRVFWSIYRVQQITSLTMLFFNVVFIAFFSSEKLYDSLFLLYTASSLLDITWFYYGIEEIKPVLTRNIIVKIVNLALIFLFVKSKNDIIPYSLIMLGGIFISQLVMWFSLGGKVQRVKVNTIEAIKTHLKPNALLFIPVIAVSVYKYMDKIMLGGLSTVVELGFYESVERIVNIPVALVSALGMVMLPRITNLNAHGNKETGLKYMRYSLAFTSFLAFGLSFGILGVIDEFVPIFFGPSFERCIDLSFYMVPTTVFLGLSNVYRTQYLIPRHLDKVFIWSVIVGAIVNLILNSILIPIMDADGAAIGTFVAELSVFTYQLIKIPKSEKMMISTVKSLVYAPGSIAMYFIIRILPSFSSSVLSMLFHILIGGLFYLAVSGGLTLILKKRFFEEKAVKEQV